jgi:hypothetical protein
MAPSKFIDQWWFWADDIRPMSLIDEFWAVGRPTGRNSFWSNFRVGGHSTARALACSFHR